MEVSTRPVAILDLLCWSVTLEVSLHPPMGSDGQHPRSQLHQLCERGCSVLTRRVVGLIVYVPPPAQYRQPRAHAHT